MTVRHRLTQGLSFLRGAGLVLALLYGGRYFLQKVDGHYPIGQWLFWRYALCWLLAILWATACLSAGHAVLKYVVRRQLPLVEHVVTAFASGVFVFFLGMLGGGLLHLYGTAFFVGWPLVLTLAGAPAVFVTGRRVRRHVRHFRPRSPRFPGWAWAVVALGALGGLLVYTSILTPGNVAFDSRWQHLGLAEHYAAEHGVSRFPEGYFVGTSPHLASFVYTWAFLLPSASLFTRVELAAHLEFVAFLFTLLGIVATVRVLVPRSRPALAWAMRFAFPGVFLYDSSLSVGADHMAALFAAPIFCLLIRSLPALDPRWLGLLTAMLVGCFVTKYTGALILMGFPLLAIAARALWLLLVAAYRAARKRPEPGFSRALVGPLVALAVGLVLLAPHWLRNWIWYGDPLYPLLAKHLSPTPWTPDSADRFYWGFVKLELWRPESVSSKSLWDTAKVLWTHSFIPNDWPKFHGKWPTFGSLFTLFALTLPFLRGARRIVLLYVAVVFGLVAWFWTHHQDRYLQTVVPWMAAGAAAVVILIFRSNIFAKVAVVAVIALQVVWGSDVWFIPGHAMIKSPIKAVADLLGSGYRKDYAARDKTFVPYTDIGAALPQGAKLLVHEQHPHLGIGVPSVNDYPVNQGGLSYGLLRSPAVVHETLTSWGVTHLMWVTATSRGTDTLAGDITFLRYATRYGVAPKAYGSFTVAAVPEMAPAAPASDLVLAITCKSPLPGVYELADLHVPVYGPNANKYPAPRTPSKGGDEEELGKGVESVLVETKCKKTMPSGLTGAFKKATLRSANLEIWIRR